MGPYPNAGDMIDEGDVVKQHLDDIQDNVMGVHDTLYAHQRAGLYSVAANVGDASRTVDQYINRVLTNVSSNIESVNTVPVTPVPPDPISTPPPCTYNDGHLPDRICPSNNPGVFCPNDPKNPFPGCYYPPTLSISQQLFSYIAANYPKADGCMMDTIPHRFCDADPCLYYMCHVVHPFGNLTDPQVYAGVKADGSGIARSGSQPWNPTTCDTPPPPPPPPPPPDDCCPPAVLNCPPPVKPAKCDPVPGASKLDPASSKCATPDDCSLVSFRSQVPYNPWQGKDVPAASECGFIQVIEKADGTLKSGDVISLSTGDKTILDYAGNKTVDQWINDHRNVSYSQLFNNG